MMQDDVVLAELFLLVQVVEKGDGKQIHGQQTDGAQQQFFGHKGDGAVDAPQKNGNGQGHGGEDEYFQPVLPCGVVELEMPPDKHPEPHDGKQVQQFGEIAEQIVCVGVLELGMEMDARQKRQAKDEQIVRHRYKGKKQGGSYGAFDQRRGKRLVNPYGIYAGQHGYFQKGVPVRKGQADAVEQHQKQNRKDERNALKFLGEKDLAQKYQRDIFGENQEDVQQVVDQLIHRRLPFHMRY